MSLESRKERRKEWEQEKKKFFLKKWSRKNPKYGKRFKFIYLRSLVNLKQDKLSENHTQEHYNQTSKNKDKENILKTDRENNILYIREWLFELSQISHQKS